MDKLLEFGLFSFTSLFTMINPLGVIPVYTTLTSQMPSAEARRVAVKSVIIAFITLLLFAFAGKFIFDFFHISIEGLRIVGGVIFFMAGYDMLQARLVRTKSDNETVSEFVEDVSITPIAIPMLSGPGSITIAIILMSDAQFLTEKGVVIFVIFLVLLITLIFLLSARKIMHFLGDSGNKVMMRIMGLIVMVIAVEFIISGITPIVREILKIS